jgi:hypothetical protein
MDSKDATRRLARSRSELEDPAGQKAASGLCNGILELVEPLDVCADRVQVFVGREVVLAQRSSPGSRENMTESRRRPSR